MLLFRLNSLNKIIPLKVILKGYSFMFANFLMFFKAGTLNNLGNYAADFFEVRAKPLLAVTGFGWQGI
jgi:hypothetical protein